MLIFWLHRLVEFLMLLSFDFLGLMIQVIAVAVLLVFLEDLCETLRRVFELFFTARS